jgi:hypothetical protein
LGRSSVVDAIEREGKLLSLVLGVRDLNHGVGLAGIDGVGSNDNITFSLLFEQRSYPGDDSDTHRVFGIERIGCEEGITKSSVDKKANVSSTRTLSPYQTGRYHVLRVSKGLL